jgi:hypothetical protein
MPVNAKPMPDWQEKSLDDEAFWILVIDKPRCIESVILIALFF